MVKTTSKERLIVGRVNKLGARDDLLKAFEDQVDAHGSHIAVIFKERKLSYGELEKASNCLAHYLIAQGIGAGDIVGLFLPRSMDMVVAILAILKSGAAYLPLDAEYPQERLNYMLQEARARKVIGRSGVLSHLKIPRDQMIEIDKSPWQSFSDERVARQTHGDSLVYCIFTSGSTGRPKAVAMGQQALCNLVQWQQKSSQMGPGHKTLQFTPMSFDVSFQEIFSTLSTAGTLVLIDEETRLNACHLLQLIVRENIDRLFLPFVALNHLAAVAVANELFPPSLKEIITAGEQLQINHHIVKFFKGLKDCSLANHYGPSESHVVSALLLTGNPQDWPALPAIGRPIDNSSMFLHAENNELYLLGDCLALGYLHRPELTQEKFITMEIKGRKVRAYKTGDRAKILPDGNMQFLGRLDGQVKVRGHRVEVGEIEVALSGLQGVSQALVTVHEDRLIAYLTGDFTGAIGTIRAYLERSLPAYMIPSAFIRVPTFARTPSGKIDRQALPAPSQDRPQLDHEYTPGDSLLEKIFISLFEKNLSVRPIGITDNFFDLGGHSLLALKIIGQLQEQHGLDISIVDFFSYGTIEKMVSGLLNKERVKPRKNRLHKADDDIAIIAMTGKFPGAKDLTEFWEVLASGSVTTTFFKAEELDPSIDPAMAQAPSYIKARGVIEDAAYFDASFFKMTPLEAQLTDPQQRLFLELAAQTLESAGYSNERYDGAIGVFAGMANNTYFAQNISAHEEKVQAFGEFNTMLGNEKDYLATRVSYKLNLTGPSVSLYTGCSTSLVAIIHAMESLHSGHCDIALAGGVAIHSVPQSGYVYQEEGIYSPDGLCRPFDEQSRGTLFNDGAGVIALKPLAAARADGDTIHAVIKAGAINNDGADKMSFMAPSREGQAEVVALAQERGNVLPSSISFIECHGTATPIGDPIEVAALTKVFGKAPEPFCALGSVKSNIGHCTAAAGVAGLIKTVLCLKNKKLVATANFNKLNQKIAQKETPFYVNKTLKDWVSSGPRRAGVSSFGVGGTNAHVILEESTRPSQSAENQRPYELLLLSAKSAQALTKQCENLCHFMQRQKIHLADASFTLMQGRNLYDYRGFLVLEKKNPSALMDVKKINDGKMNCKKRPLVFMFPGQGSQYINMGRDFYNTHALFRSIVDECAQQLTPLLGRDIRELLFPTAGDRDLAEQSLKNTFYTQPALFIIQYALAKLLQSLGIKPDLLIGHSIGEFVAATLAGVFSLADGLELIALRGRMMRDLPPGSMLAVRASAERVRPLLNERVQLAAINSAKLCVVAGPASAITELSEKLSTLQILSKLLHTSHAFHSAMMEPIVAPFTLACEKIVKKAGTIPIYSTVRNKIMQVEDTGDAHYWGEHLRSTVDFYGALKGVREKVPNALYIEVGPRATLSTLLKQMDHSLAVVPTMPSGYSENNEWAALLEGLGLLWCRGVELTSEKYFGLEKRKRIALPTYPFARKKYWLAPRAYKNTQLKNEPEKDLQKVENMQERKASLIIQLREIFEETSGIEMAEVKADMTFFELGFDSLLMTQMALTLKNKFSLNITFRALLEDYGNLDLLASWMDTQLPREISDNQPGAHIAPLATGGASAVKEISPSVWDEPVAPPAFSATPLEHHEPAADAGSLASLIKQQMQLMNRHLDLLTATPAQKIAPPQSSPKAIERQVVKLPAVKTPPAFGAQAKISLEKSTQLQGQQEKVLANFIQVYNEKTKASKEFTAKNRKIMADPRVVSGFRPELKEIIYPIVVNKSQLQYLWDLDGNKYIDMTSGFGSNYFGNLPSFIKEALINQLQVGIEIGPQTPLAADVSRLIGELTKMPRVALCNTGSEAVMGAMRLARTVTGKKLIIAFNGSYHGINDEVIVRGSKKLKSFAAAPGINPEAVENMLILDYGCPEALEIMRQRKNDMAAIMLEPVQSRHPDNQPLEFIRECRKITNEVGAALIFDEVITGFRAHPGGAQAYFDIRADICTYGKIIGGGMPIGAIAGCEKFMDALDGGDWQYGDDSTPTVGVTYFAGTFVRHPLTLAAAKAALTYLQEQGEALQMRINARTKIFVDDMNRFFTTVGAPLKIVSFASQMKIKWREEYAYGELLYAYLRFKGVHIWDGFPWFIGDGHSEEDLQFVLQAFKESVGEMQQAGFLPAATTATKQTFVQNMDCPPQAGAQIAINSAGTPAWFIEDELNPGEYREIEV